MFMLRMFQTVIFPVIQHHSKLRQTFSHVLVNWWDFLSPQMDRVFAAGLVSDSSLDVFMSFYLLCELVIAGLCCGANMLKEPPASSIVWVDCWAGAFLLEEALSWSSMFASCCFSRMVFGTTGWSSWIWWCLAAFHSFTPAQELST